GVRYALFGFCMAEAQAETDLRRSFHQSALLSAGAWAGLFGVLAALLLFNVLGACLLGLGLLITVPLSALVTAGIYRQLSSHFISPILHASYDNADAEWLSADLPLSDKVRIARHPPGTQVPIDF